MSLVLQFIMYLFRLLQQAVSQVRVESSGYRPGFRPCGTTFGFVEVEFLRFGSRQPLRARLDPCRLGTAGARLNGQRENTGGLLLPPYVRGLFWADGHCVPVLNRGCLLRARSPISAFLTNTGSRSFKSSCGLSSTAWCNRGQMSPAPSWQRHGCPALGYVSGQGGRPSCTGATPPHARRPCTRDTSWAGHHRHMQRANETPVRIAQIGLQAARSNNHMTPACGGQVRCRAKQLVQHDVATALD